MKNLHFEIRLVLATKEARNGRKGNQTHLFGQLMQKTDKKKFQIKAIENLKLLSGKTHFQNSGVCIYLNNNCLWEYSETVELQMHNLAKEEIENYVEIENPINAAGAYKFESLGCNLFSSVKGSSYTVRGMPLLPLLNALRELQIISLK